MRVCELIPDLGPWESTLSAEVPPPIPDPALQLETSFPTLPFSAAPPLPSPASPGEYQSSTAEQDHEDDEGLEPAVLHDVVAGLAQSPPDLPWGLRGVHSAAGTAPNTAYGGVRGLRPRPGAVNAHGRWQGVWWSKE